jgi:predicted extracellular nuclease
MHRTFAGLAAAALAVGTVAVVTVVPVAPAGAAPTELLFSEYAEGSGFNKAIEIYNGTGAPVDLALGGYRLELYSNGSATVSQSVGLTGTIADGDVFVVSRADADPRLVGEADQLAPAVVNWNGDDAVALRKGGTAGALVDVIGQIGVDPGAQWGTGEASTADNTIRRVPAIETGDTNGGDPFDPAVEWVGFPTDTVDGFGKPGLEGDPPPPPTPRPIGEVQGVVSDTTDGATFESPLEGQQVVVRAVVTQKTLARSSSGALQNGFFLQDTPATADADPLTSDGIFVFLGGFTTLLRADGGPAYLPQVGDELLLRGNVTEFFALTQLSSPRLIEVASTGHDPDTDVVVTEAAPPVDLAAANRFWERHEGERIRVPAGSLATSGRDVFPSTADSEVWLIRPDDPLAARTDPFARRVFRDAHPLDNAPGLFDDGNGNRIMLGSIGVKAQSGDSFELLPPARLFDTLTDDVVGGLYFSFEKYGVQAEAAAFTPGVDPSTNLPPAAARRNEEVAVASYNVENLYDFRDDPTDSCDFVGGANTGCPGVVPPFDYVPASDAVYRARLVEIADQITDDLHSPDIVLTQEGEDQDICKVTAGALVCGTVPGSGGDGDGKPDTLQDLALAIAATGGGAYDAASDRDGADARGIVSGFLYRTDRVSLVTAAAGDAVLGANPGVTYRTPGLAYNADVANPKVLNAVLPGDIDTSTGTDGSNVYTRAPQVGRFRVQARPGANPTGDSFEVWAISNHFSSGPDGRVGQRREQAAYGAAIVDAIEAGYPGARVLYGGDLNVFPRPDDPFVPGDPLFPSDQLAALYDTGLHNLWDDLVAESPAAAYSYVFQGQGQTLDQLYVNDPLYGDLVQARVAHVNAGWPADFPGDGPRGLSDHDPAVVRFDSRAHLSVDDVSVTEGNSGRRPATFTVEVSRPLAVDVTVCVVPVPLTASADRDFDWALPCKRLAAGATSVDIAIQVRGDRQRERDETFGILAVAGSGIVLDDPVAFATIVNDD